jgi:tRNA dimethylallyltransferase
VDEVRGLMRRYALHPDLPSMRAVGYRQAWDFIAGTIDAPALRARGIAATRQLAKRQYTWLRAVQATAYDAFAGDTRERVMAAIDDALR